MTVRPITRSVTRTPDRATTRTGYPSWVPAGAAFVMDFTKQRAWQGDIEKRFDEVDGYSFTRSAPAWALRPDGPLIQYSQNAAQCPMGRGYVAQEGRSNLFLNSGAPVTQTVTVSNATAYTVSVVGSGSITLSGALTGTVTEGSPVTGTTGSTSLVCTVAGDLDYAQVEEGDFATEVILTGGSPFSRSLGDLSIDLGLTSGEWRNVPLPGGGYLEPSEGFWAYVKYKQRAGFLANSRIIEMSNGTTANRVTLLQNTTLGGPQWQVFVSSAAQAALGSSESNGPIKAAASFLPNDIGAAINGAATARDASASLPTISEIVIGLSAGGANPANTDIALVAIGQGTLTDAQLEALSA